MDKIYAGAYFTIVAAAPEEMYEDDQAFEALVSESMPPRYGDIEEVMSKDTKRCRDRNGPQEVGHTRSRFYAKEPSSSRKKGFSGIVSAACGME